MEIIVKDRDILQIDMSRNQEENFEKAEVVAGVELSKWSSNGLYRDTIK